MKTNLGIETTDAEREKIARTLGLEYKLAKREDIKEAIYEYVKNELISPKHHSGTTSATEETTRARTTSGRDQSVSGFVPSRGDEGYVYSGKDSELTAACSAVLDATERLDELIWIRLEENRT